MQSFPYSLLIASLLLLFAGRILSLNTLSLMVAASFEQNAVLVFSRDLCFNEGVEVSRLVGSSICMYLVASSLGLKRVRLACQTNILLNVFPPGRFISHLHTHLVAASFEWNAVLEFLRALLVTQTFCQVGSIYFEL